MLIPQVLRATGWVFTQGDSGVVQLSGSLVILENQRPGMPAVAVAAQLDSTGTSSEISLSLSWDLAAQNITDFPSAELSVDYLSGTLTLVRSTGELTFT